MDLAIKICEKLGLDPNLQLKKKIRGLTGFSLSELIEAILHSSNLEECASMLGYTLNPIKQAIKTSLSEYFPTRSKEFCGGRPTSWRYELLQVIDYKYCNKCDSCLPKSYFYKNTNRDCRYSLCNTCTILKSKQHKRYIEERTPVWSDLDLIEEFYHNCPVGYEVDHIIPLRGKLVSGLHVITNLQYLTQVENRSKQNKFEL